MKKLLLTICMALPTLFILGQAPGGVTASVWYKADAGVYSNAGTTAAADNATVQQWNDQMGTGYNLAQVTAGQRPTFSNQSTLANFNPTVSFNADFMTADPGNGNAIINRIQGSIYVTGKMNAIGAAGLAGFDATMDYPGLHTSQASPNDKLLFYTAGSGYTTNSTNSFTATKAFVAGSSWLNGGGTPVSNVLAKVWLDGNENIYNNTDGNVNAGNPTRIFRIGGDSNWGSLNGQLNETIVFANPLSASEKARVDSYLSVKWGSTLLGNYVNSTGGIVWNSDASYQNNIFGIARDNNGALHQKQSRSENKDQKLIIGNGNGLFNTNAANTNSLADGQFLLVGDNGLKQSLSTPFVYTGGTNGATNYRFEAVWKVNNTGAVGNVTVAWPKGIKNLYLVQSSDQTFAGGNTFTPMVTEVTVNGVVYNTATVTLGNGQYFTLAGFEFGPGGVKTAAWYRADAGTTLFSDAGTTAAADNSQIQQWNEFNAMGTNISQATLANRPVYSNSTTLTNFNPTVTFDGSNDILLYQPSTNGNVNILDRSKGALFSAGNITGIGAMLGFGPASDDPGLYSYSGTNNLLLYPQISEYDAISTGSTTGHYIGGGTWENGAGAAGNNAVLLSLRGNHQVFTTNIDNVRLEATRNDLRVGGDTDYARLDGQQNEVIIFPNKLTDDEVTKVESYLAVKYGQTLSSVQNRNYLSATGNVIWDGTNNSAYYNNIAGIGREDISALYQKQSRSVNANQKLIIGAGNSLTDTNAANTNTLTDGQFLLVGDNGLKQTLTTPLAYTGGANGDVNYRFESIWKAQNTGTVGTVTVAWPKEVNNLYLVQSTDAAFDGNDTFSPMATEVTVNGVVYNTATVTLGNGQYFTFAGYMYAPGGVLSAAWYRADAAVYSDAGTTSAADNTTVQQWDEFNNKPFPLTQAAAAQKPTFSNQSTLANFNPTVTFISAGHGTGQGGFMAADPGSGNEIINRTQGSIYTSGKMNTLGAAGLAGFDASMNYPGLHISNNATTDKLLFFSGGTYNTLSTNLFAAQKPFVAGSSWLNGGGTPTSNALTKVWLDGNENIYNNTSSNINTGNTLRIFRIGRDTDWGSHDGQLNETIVFEDPLSASEKARVDSYLSVKWGSTLIGDYVNSGSTVVWNTSATYQNNILGIARDNISALYQKQSRSENPNQKLIIGAGNSLANTNAANTNTLTDGQFLIVGDNGLKQRLYTPLSYTAGSNGATNFRFESVWKAQNTGTVGNVTVAWPKGIKNLYLVQSSDQTFAGGNTYTPMSTEVTVNGIVYNTANVTLANGQFFTFAGYQHAPGGVLSSLWYRADKGLAPAAGAVTSWTDYSAGQVVVTPALSSSTSAPSSVDGIGLNFNFNPAVTFAAANALGNTSVLNALTGGNYTIYTSTGVASGDRIVGLNYSNLTGAASYDSPGIGATASGIRNSAGTIVFNTNIAPGYRYTDLTNTSIVRNTFTNTLFTRSFNGDVAGGNVTYSNTTTGANGGIIFGRNANNGGDDAGSDVTMSETIVFDGALSANDINKVDSYLAIKGGITLNTTNTPNYLSSNSTNVWNGSANTGYNNNIFGIANDYVSDLHQKQSKSINADQKLIIGAGSSLANTNAANTNTLIDGQFLIVGNNGLKQSLAIPLAYTAGSNGAANFRFESVWKAQNTGTVGNVTVAWPKGVKNLYLVQSANATFASGNTFTPMTTEVTVNGVVYNTANVTLADGQFFTFAGLGYAPGGVTNGLSYWYRADVDAANTGAATDVTTWKDVWSGTTVAQLGTNPLPKYVQGAVNYFNFNPGINFTDQTQSLGNYMVRTFSADSYDVFTFTNDFTTGLPNHPSLFRSLVDNSLLTGSIRRWDGLGIITDNRIERLSNTGGNTDYYGTPAGAFSTTIPSIMYHTFTALTTTRALNGAANFATTNHSGSGVRNLNGGHLFGNSLFSSNGSDNRGFIGHLGETIIYGAGNITATERRRVDSYLAIKYGITMGRVNTDHYLDADGNMVWNGGSNTIYNNNIFGVAREDIGLFEQKVSKSVNAGTILTVATTNDFVNPNLNGARTGFANDKTYFLLGDNNNVTTTTVNVTVGTNTYKRIQRAWMTQEKKSDAGALFFEADLAAYNLAISDIVGKVVMLVADDANFTTNVQAINPLSNSGGKYIYNQNIADGKYITFAAYWFDTDGDGVTDACDLDNDNDGILDVNEKSCELTGQTIRIGYIPNSRDLSSDNGYTFDGQYMNNSGALKLTNPANFGPAGTVKANIVLVNMGTAPITKAIINSLNLNAIFLGGIDDEVSSSYLSASEFNAIKDWSDDSLNNLVVATQLQAQQWGRTIAVTSLSNTHTPTSYGNQTSIFNGPFGNITSYNQDASKQWFFLDAVSACNTGTLAVYGGNATRAEMYIDGTYNDLMISGVDILTTKGGVTAGNAITSTNDKLFANIFAFVAQQSACTNKDTDGDSIPDYLDLDSDNDGCLDAIEGDENVTTAQLVNAASGLSVGLGSSAANQNLCASGTCIDTFGVPTVVNSGGAADIGGDQGQAIGSSANTSVSTCTPPYCYKPGLTGVGLDTKVGITSLNRAGVNADNWPMTRKGGWLALESKTKGFVPNRVAFSGGNPVGIAPANFVEGMMVYDDTNKCMKIYTQKQGDPSMAWHCMTTQTCPD